MTGIGLRLGPIAVPGHSVSRSGFRWIHPDGYVCRPGEAVAYCSIGVRPSSGDRTAVRPFAEEKRDFQAVLASQIGGRLHHRPGSSRGGFLDQHQTYGWDENLEIGWIDPPGAGSEHVDDPGLLRLMLAAGRRVTELAEVRSGVLTGWHDRTRTWWGEGTEPTGTLLAMATCEQFGILRGPSSAFFELFSEIGGPAQVVVILDEPLVPCARVLAEQMTRTQQQRSDIAHDLATTFVSPGTVPGPADWIFLGGLLNALNRSPITDDTTILRRDGLLRTGPAAAVLLSSNAEPRMIGRHRRLGYTVSFHHFRMADASPVVTRWLRANFEMERRSAEDIRQDYLRLLKQVGDSTGARLLVINRLSTSAHEQIHTYAGLPEPLGNTIGSVQNKDVNLMLHDLARDHALDIVDVDAIAARLGTREHMPDGTHQSGRMHAEVRMEITRILRDRNVSGFQARTG